MRYSYSREQILQTILETRTFRNKSIKLLYFELHRRKPILKNINFRNIRKLKALKLLASSFKAVDVFRAIRRSENSERHANLYVFWDIQADIYSYIYTRNIKPLFFRIFSSMQYFERISNYEKYYKYPGFRWRYKNPKYWGPT